MFHGLWYLCGRIGTHDIDEASISVRERPYAPLAGGAIRPDAFLYIRGFLLLGDAATGPR